MSPSEAAQRRAERFSARHHRFVRAALLRMRRHGLSGVNLTDLAADSPYSKGTWYNHFSSAEALYLDVALINAELHTRYVDDIRDDPTLDPSARLVSVFISSVAHAIAHPEIWNLGINARMWNKSPDDDVTGSVRRLAESERAIYGHILEFACAAQVDPGRGEEELTRALDMVRAAADGLSVLTTTKPDHRWTREVTTRQTGALLRGALTVAGFNCPPPNEMDALCAKSRERVSKLSGEWLLDG
ncbi:TetR/AcrR family transcriptional regulator [Jiangella endophytica]|uniref:TetR/AcrR family transcriptional regulator n=1 Tax=Jiangella endophytica TaxID=1623398 RepID=UPI000E351615|nr:TetR/AcrR family transcriptional regulator [Jiangella endophytica]